MDMDVRNKSPTYQGIYSPQIPMNETRLRVIMDSQTTLSMTIPVAPGRLTLGQFKNFASLTQDHYKFYFKSQDVEFGTVKEELVDDDSILPVEDGEIVVWVISDHRVQSSLFETESPYETRMQIEPTDSVDNYTIERRPPSTYGRLNGLHYEDRITVNLFLDPYSPLGLTVLCPSDDLDQMGGIFIDKVQPNSIASRHGQIRQGDRIVDINGINLSTMRASEAVRIFKQFVDRKGAINMVLQRTNQISGSRIYDYRPGKSFNNELPKPAQQSYLSTSRPTKGFDPATELPAPIVDLKPTPPIAMTNRVLPKVKSHRTAYSLPRSMTPRSLYTTSNLDNLTASNDFQHPLDSRSVYEPTTPNSVRQISVALHCGKDDIYTIYSALKSDAASLDIKNRDWLKVVVENAFLGSTLVKWLTRNVYGFCNRSEVKRFANQMLSLGLINSPMSNSTFSEKCYYTLT